jgi:hypothetical protein
MGRAGEEGPLNDISILQPVEREIERFDNRQEFDRKISRRELKLWRSSSAGRCVAQIGAPRFAGLFRRYQL